MQYFESLYYSQPAWQALVRGREKGQRALARSEGSATEKERKHLQQRHGHYIFDNSRPVIAIGLNSLRADYGLNPVF